MKFFLILLSIFALTSCAERKEYQRISSDKENLADDLLKKIATELQKEKELYPCGSGGQMMNEIQMLSLSFFYYKPIETEEARKLLLSATEKFLDEVNRDNRIQPYLHHHPFTPGNVDLAVYLKTPENKTYGPGKLCIVSMEQGVLKYYITDPETRLCKVTYTEPYEKALNLPL